MANKGYPGANEGQRGESGEKEPKGVAKADTKGERHEGKKNGIGMGKRDATGSNGCYDTGRTSGTCYTHTKGYKG